MKAARISLIQIAQKSDQRYRIYREHKYVTLVVDDFVRVVQKADFKNISSINEIKNKLGALRALMEGHAAHEDNCIHQLLRDKALTIQASIEADHKDHQEQFKEFEEMLDKIIKASDAQERRSMGFAFYILLRNFQQENLRHINEEETIIMPALQELYSDDALKKSIDFKTYAHMTVEEMIQMIDVLFPVMNRDDKEFFLNDIKEAEPEKFSALWKEVSFKYDF